MIDLHSHILPGVDDGVATLDEARTLARAVLADGAAAIAATPHVRDDWPTSADRMEEGVAALRQDFAEQGIELDVLTGGELALDRLPTLDAGELRRFSLAGSERYVLVEFPYAGWPLGLDSAIHDLGAAGLTPLLAHPERNRTVQEQPERLERALGAGALVQVTASSVDGRGGTAARTAARRLLELGFVHVVASDAPPPGGPGGRPRLGRRGDRGFRARRAPRPGGARRDRRRGLDSGPAAAAPSAAPGIVLRIEMRDRA